MGDEMEGAVQQAPQPARQIIRGLWVKSREPQAPRRGGPDPLRQAAHSPMEDRRPRKEPNEPRRYYPPVTPYTIMKLSVPTLVTILAIGGGVATLSTGCAGTSTRESTGEYIDDTTISTKVKAAFVKDPLVKALDVKVDTFKGAVQLSGFVDTTEQKSRAEQIAAGVTGVSTVKNNITVKTGANP
jgi:hypothetical protein